MRVRLSKNGLSSSSCDRVRLRQADVDERARVPEHLETLRDRLRTADDVEDEVELLARPGVRRAETPRRVQLPLVEVERVDLRGAGDPRALHRGEPDGAAADHADTRSFPDLRRLEHRADAGRDRAADQARLLDGQLFRDGNRSGLVHDRARRERAELERLEQLLSRPRASRRAARGGVRQRRSSPRAHQRHSPHGDRQPRTTRSPTRSATPSPTASTTPAPSCPSNTGSGCPNPVSSTCRSVWQTPVASSRTSTSPGPGSSISSSTSSSRPSSGTTTPRSNSRRARRRRARRAARA